MRNQRDGSSALHRKPTGRAEPKLAFQRWEISWGIVFVSVTYMTGFGRL